MKFAPLTFSREFEIGFALYLQKHKENLTPTFALRMGIKGSRWFRKASWEGSHSSHGWGYPSELLHFHMVGWGRVACQNGWCQPTFYFHSQSNGFTTGVQLLVPGLSFPICKWRIKKHLKGTAEWFLGSKWLPRHYGGNPLNGMSGLTRKSHFKSLACFAASNWPTSLC